MYMTQSTAQAIELDKTLFSSLWDGKIVKATVNPNHSLNRESHFMAAILQLQTYATLRDVRDCLKKVVSPQTQKV